MAYGKKKYDDTNKGVLFKNDKKESEKHPDLKGSININGVEYWLSAWSNEHAEKGKYLKLSVQPKEDKAGFTPSKAPAAKPAAKPSDDDAAW